MTYIFTNLLFVFWLNNVDHQNTVRLVKTSSFYMYKVQWDTEVVLAFEEMRTPYASG